MSINTDYMREFVVLAGNLNFSVTAEQLYITQPSLTRHITQIEEEMGIQLFFRTTHNVELTPGGKLVQEKFTEILGIYDQLIDQTTALSRGYAGVLKIGVPYYAIDRYIIPIVNYLKEASPDIKLDIFTYQPKQIISALLDGHIDIGLLYQAQYANSNLVNFYPFANENLEAVISVDNPLKEKETLTLKDVADSHFVRIEDHDWLNGYIDHLLQNAQLELSDLIYTPQIDTLKIDLIKEKGVSLVESHLCVLAGKELVFKKVEDLDFHLKMSFTAAVKNENPLIKSIIKGLCKKDLFHFSE